MERRLGSIRVFKTNWFQRFARKEKIGEAALADAVARAEKGQVDADLGGGIIKQRIARPGQGKSGGYRTIIFFRRGSAPFSLMLSRRAIERRIDADEEKQIKEAAGHVLRLTENQIDELLKNGDFVEVKYEEKTSK